MTDADDRWFVTEHGAVLYGDDTGGATIAGIANHWNQHDERNEALTKLNAFVRDLAAQLATARTVGQGVLDYIDYYAAPTSPSADAVKALRAWLAGSTEPTDDEDDYSSTERVWQAELEHELSADCWCEPEVHNHGEYPDAEERLLWIEAKLQRHLNAQSDPCQDRGVDWPCDVAEALGVVG